MERMENMLTYDQSLEGGVAELRDEFDALVDQTRTKYGDILDPYHEAERDMIVLWEFSSKVGESIASDDDEQPVVRDAVYRAVCFATQIADEMLSEAYSYNLIKYIRERTDGTYAMGPIIEDSQEYLQSRPELDALLGYYMPEIDRSGQHNHVVETFAGIVLMLSERSIGEQQLASTVEDVAIDDFLDGDR